MILSYTHRPASKNAQTKNYYANTIKTKTFSDLRYIVKRVCVYIYSTHYQLDRESRPHGAQDRRISREIEQIQSKKEGANGRRRQRLGHREI